MTPHQSGYDALADSTVEANLGLSTPNDSMPCQQGMDEGTTNYTPDHIFAWKNPSVLIDQTKSSGDGLKTAQTYLGANKESGATETSTKVKMEDLSQFMYDTRSTFLAPDCSTNEPIIVSDESDAEEDADTNTGETTVIALSMSSSSESNDSISASYNAWCVGCFKYLTHFSDEPFLRVQLASVGSVVESDP
uniref:Uncharacterized protein n=1 Tax=Tanacetum cinerariifolium TaxID=118510 RepID=A0A6L2NX19_TANCI|nr:hypothetical protein [Tanacetum cinerariifolium]